MSPTACKRKISGAYKNQKPQYGRAEVSDFFCIFCNFKNILVNSQNYEKEVHFSCTRSSGFRYFDFFPFQKPRPALRKRISLRKSGTGSAWTGDFCQKLTSLPG